MGFTLDPSELSSAATTPSSTSNSGPVYVVLGVPLRTGSLYPGNENDAQAYREAGIIASLTAAGCNALDGGDIPIPSYLPHHSVPPIRSWPGPRIVWEILSEKVTEVLKKPQQIPLLIGCDCSVVVGTAKALRRLPRKTSTYSMWMVTATTHLRLPHIARAQPLAQCGFSPTLLPLLGRLLAPAIATLASRLLSPIANQTTRRALFSLNRDSPSRTASRRIADARSHSTLCSHLASSRYRRVPQR